MKRKSHRVEAAPPHKEEDDGAASDSAHSTEDSVDAPDDRLIKSVNELPTCEFKDRYIGSDDLSYTFKSNNVIQNAIIDFKASSDLSKEEISSCFGLIETTSRADYEPSSFGWHPKRKRREMVEKEMQYLLVREPVPFDDASPSTNADLKAAETVQGFLSFMMTHDSTPSVPVLYVYEIHLAEILRGTRLGAHLMLMAESIAAKVGVEKVMLTCFLSNEKALKFYEKRGYGKDECSPDDRRTRNKVIKVDYMIMSKIMNGDAAHKGLLTAAQSGSGLIATVRDWTSKLAGTQMHDGKDVAQMRGWI